MTKVLVYRFYKAWRTYKNAAKSTVKVCWTAFALLHNNAGVFQITVLSQISPNLLTVQNMFTSNKICVGLKDK